MIAEQISHDPVLPYVEKLKVEAVAKDALSYTKVEGTADEWSNIPPLVARYLFYMQEHLACTVKYLKGQSLNETTEALRTHLQAINDGQDTKFTNYVDTTGFQLDNIEGFNKRILKYAMLVDKESFELKNYFDEQKNDSMLHMFGAKPSELQNDNVGTEHAKDDLDFEIKHLDEYRDKMITMKDSREIQAKEGDFERGWSCVPNEVEDDRLKARTISFKQLYDFTNLVLNRSYLKKRTAVSEEKIASTKESITEM